MRQLVRSWMNLHTKTSCCCWGQNVSLPLVLFVFLQPCQRSASLEQLPFQSVPASCSLILQLCLLSTFRHYSFSPGSEPCKLWESPSTHTHTQIHGNQSCQISTSEVCSGRGAVGAQAFLFFLHSEKEKCHDLLFWHSHREYGGGAAGSNSKSFVRRSPDQICMIRLLCISTFTFLTNMTQTLTKNQLSVRAEEQHVLFICGH